MNTACSAPKVCSAQSIVPFVQFVSFVFKNKTVVCGGGKKSEKKWEESVSCESFLVYLQRIWGDGRMSAVDSPFSMFLFPMMPIIANRLK